MKKNIKIKIYNNDILTNEYNKINAIVNKDSYKFKVEDIMTIISDKYLKRESDEYLFHLDILNKEARIELKKGNMLFPVEVEHLHYLKNDKGLEIEYKIYSNEEIIKIVVEDD